MRTPAVAATALGLSRNEASRRFPHAEDPAVLEDLRAQVVDLLQADEWNGGWEVHNLDRLSMVEVEHLVERGLMTPGFAEGVGEGRGFAVYGEGQASLEINGVDHLRVVDASVMPYVTNGNIYAPVMMIAEKAADLIRGNTPLAPERLPYYRHPN